MAASSASGGKPTTAAGTGKKGLTPEEEAALALMPQVAPSQNQPNYVTTPQSKPVINTTAKPSDLANKTFTDTTAIPTATTTQNAGLGTSTYDPVTKSYNDNIKFNNDGSVIYNGQNLTAAEYANVLGHSQSTSTAATQAIIQDRINKGLQAAPSQLNATQEATRVKQEAATQAAANLPLQQQAVSQIGNLNQEQINRDVVQNNPFDKLGIAGKAAGAGIGAGLATGTGAGIATTAAITGATGLGAGAVAATGIGAVAIGAGIVAYSLAERNDAKKATSIYTNSKETINALAMAIDKGFVTTEELMQYVGMYNEQKANLISARNNLKEQTDNDLKKFLTGADNQYFDVNNYIENQLPAFEDKLRNAILTPNLKNQNAIQ